MAAPYALEPVELHLTDNSAIPVSEPFITMTLKLMEAFGIKVERPSTHTFIVPIGIYKNPEFYDIEPDATAATYDMA
jgi:pentafunctional AROM polypeptide